MTSAQMAEFKFKFDELDADLYHLPCRRFIDLNPARTLHDIWVAACEHECSGDDS